MIEIKEFKPKVNERELLKDLVDDIGQFFVGYPYYRLQIHKEIDKLSDIQVDGILDTLVTKLDRLKEQNKG